MVFYHRQGKHLGRRIGRGDRVPHCFEVELAEKYGLLEAILLNYFQFWIKKNEANDVHFHDGRYWTYNSVKAFCELFPYASKKMIENAINHLVEEGLLITGNYNQSAYDRTKWYTLTEKGKCISPTGEMECTEKGNGVPPQGKPIPVNKPYSNSSRGKAKFTPPTREEVRAYCKEKGFVIDPDYFFDYYDSDNWMKGNSRNSKKEPMKNWKQTAISWNKRELERNPQKAKQKDEPHGLSQEELQRIAEEGRRRDRGEVDW